MFLQSFSYICAYDSSFDDMDKAQRQRGSIILHKEKKDGVDYVRIEYAGNGAIPLLLAQDTGVEMTGQEVLDYLEGAYDKRITGSDFLYNYDTAGGLIYTVDPSAEKGRRIRIISMWD